jgi:hypothetical protein
MYKPHACTTWLSQQQQQQQKQWGRRRRYGDDVYNADVEYMIIFN